MVHLPRLLLGAEEVVDMLQEVEIMVKMVVQVEVTVSRQMIGKQEVVHKATVET